MPPRAIQGKNPPRKIQPTQAQTLLDHAVTLHQQGKLDAAREIYDRILAVYPKQPDCLHLLGVIALQTGQHESALKLIGSAAKLDPGNAAFHSNMGLAYLGSGKYMAAIEHLRKATVLQPGYAAAFNNLGNALKATGELTEALASYDRAIALQPENTDALNNRGVALRELGRWREAIDSCEEAIHIAPHFAEAYSNLGTALVQAGRFDEAISRYDEAIRRKPEYADAHYNRGNALKALGRLDEALISFEQALLLQPDHANALWNKSLAFLLGGNFVQGWPLYESRWRVPPLKHAVRSFAQPLWLGESSLAGKSILIHSEQGLGDTIQFCRYVSPLAASGARVFLEVQPPLVALLKQLPGVELVFPAGDPLPTSDFHCPLLSLPLAFSRRRESEPASVPYLSAPSEKIEAWRQSLGPWTAPRIGLVWSGSRTHNNDLNRSIPLSLLLPHLSDNCQFFSLQKDVRDSDLTALRSCPAIRHLGDQLADFSDTAALCLLMDRVVCVDTSVAHLSAALGRPTTILLPFHPDWRWMLDRSDSLWYPSALLLRQRAPDDWSAPLDLLRRHLIVLTRAEN